MRSWDTSSNLYFLGRETRKYFKMPSKSKANNSFLDVYKKCDIRIYDFGMKYNIIEQEVRDVTLSKASATANM